MKKKLIKNFVSDQVIFGVVNDATPDIPAFTPSGARNPVRLLKDGTIEPMYSYQDL